MDKLQATNLIKSTFNSGFDKIKYRNFIINLLDGIDEAKEFTCGNAYIPDSFKNYVTSYGRIGKYTDSKDAQIEVLWVKLKPDTSLERARTVQRNFIAWYLNGGRGGIIRDNALVAFYNEAVSDWRFSFVKLDVALKQDDEGKVKIVNEFTPAKRYSFLVGEQEPNHTAQARLISYLIKDYPTVEEIEEAFNVEKVSKEFFANYKELFLQLVDNLKDIRKNDDRINYEFTLKSITEANFCKKLLGQLVFLYFIQKKGWLGVSVHSNWGEGDKQFLRHTFEKAVKENKNFFNDYLEPLFYDALANGERDNNYFSLLDCKIPFLNGGLFETIGGYDWVNTDIVLENEIFSNSTKTKNGDIGTGILDVFDRYNFTVKEDEPLEKEVAVDPEMLGKVFEELLEVQDRKSKGAFYTPREIVHYMCQESLINYLCTELGVNDEEDNNEHETNAESSSKIVSESHNLTKQDISDFIHHSDKISQIENIATEKENSNSKYKHILSLAIKDNAERIDKALENIKICDPAIGSGAFPVGMINEIVRARTALVESGFLKPLKKRTVYEYKRQAIQNSIYGVDIESGAVEIAKLRLWLSLVVDEENIENIKALPNLDYKIVCGNSLLRVERNLFNDTLFRQLEELKPLFFNETRKIEKKKLKKEIDTIIKELTKDGTFDFEIYFSEVFHEKGGFDVVIANPPYVEFKNLNKQLKDKLSMYVTAKGKYDLYIPFIEKGLLLTNINGNLDYICPTRFMIRDYGTYLRKYISKNYKIITISDFSDIQIFDSAMTYTGIFQIAHKKFTDKFQYSKFIKNIEVSRQLDNALNNPDKNSDIVEYNEYNDEILNQKVWNFNNNNLSVIFNKMKRDSQTLKEISDGILQGIATGKDDVFMITKDIINQYNISNKYLYKILKGKDISTYAINWSKKYLIYTYTDEGKVISEDEIKYEDPQLYQYLLDNRDKLKGRGYFDKSAKNWYELWNQRKLYKFNQLKIITLDNASKNSFALDNEKFLGTTTTYSILLKDNSESNYKYTLALLNSNLLDFYHKNNTIPQAGGFYRYQAIFINDIPIKKADTENQNKFVSIVNKILAITQSDDYLEDHEKQNAVKEYEKQIDIMVYKLYDLTFDEVLYIDKEFTLSEEDYNKYEI